MTHPGTAEAQAERSAGDRFRAQLRDLDWVRGASAGELRACIHALCWRTHRPTIDGLCCDPIIAEKVLIIARGVSDEIAGRIAVAEAGLAESADEAKLAELRREHTALTRRKVNADAVVGTCDAAVQFARIGDRHAGPSAAELSAAIIEHRNQVHPEDACQADTQLWQVLGRSDRAREFTPTH